MIPLYIRPRRIRWSWAVLLFGVVLLIWSGGGPRAGRAQTTDPELRQQIRRDVRGADLRGKDGPLAKVGTQLARVYREYERHQRQKAGRPFRPSRYARSVADGYVTIDAIATSDVRALRMRLERLGLRGAATAGRLVSGYLPIDAIPEAARLEGLRSAQVAVAMVSAGSVTTQGDAAMRADTIRNAIGVTGAGITVGVLSDSYDVNPDASTSAMDDIESGDLPPAARIQILQDGDSGSDEGRAMMQIIHDVAPGADLAFHTALGGQATFANGIRSLASSGSGVIVDDIFYLTEPMFQDGIIAQAVDEVVDGGASYFSAAGNSARESYASDFRGSGQTGPGGGTLHDFSGGDTRQQITIPEGDSVSISFQWTDPYASAGGVGASSDLDIYLLDRDGNEVASSIFDNNGSAQTEPTDPLEFLEFKNDGSIDADDDGTPDETFDLVIELIDGPAPARIKYIYFPGDADPDDGQAVTIDEYDTQSATIFGHSNAAGAGTIGAVFWFATPEFEDQFTNPFAVNPFSSVGGLPIYFRSDGTLLPSPEVRNKPNFVGPDGGNNTFFGQQLNDGPDGETGDGFPNFFGTSAAAPHVAAVAALMLEFDPSRSPQQVYADLQETALDMTEYLSGQDTEPIPNGGGFDFFSGYGFVQADEAVPLNAEVVQISGALTADQNRVELRWMENDVNDPNLAAIERYFVERKYFEGTFEAAADVPSEGAGTYSITTDNLGLGIYTFRLHWRRTDGTRDTSTVMPRVTVGLTSFEAAFNETDGNAVDLSWTVPEATSGYRYVVQRRADGGFTNVDTTTGTSATVDDLQPGRYDFRLLMQDAQGNAFGSEVVEEPVPFEGAIAFGNAYPNPSTGRIHFPVTLAADEFVTVRVYNALGQLVKIRGESFDEDVPSTLTIEPDDAWTSGVYFVQIEGEGFTVSRRAVLVR